MRAQPSIRDLLQAYKADPASLTPAQLSAVERLLRDRKEAARKAQAGDGGAERKLTKEDVAGILKVHVRTITRYASEGMPHDVGGHGKPHLYNLAECVQWVRANGRLEALGGEPAKDSTRAEVDLKLRREKARLAELDRLEREHALHDTEDCRARRLRQLWALKREFLALPRSAAPELEGHDRAETEAILKARITGILARFAGAYTEEPQMDADGRRRGRQS